MHVLDLTTMLPTIFGGRKKTKGEFRNNSANSAYPSWGDSSQNRHEFHVKS